MNDTPIFDRLAKERGFDYLVEPTRYTIWPNITNPGWVPAEEEEEETVETEQPDETENTVNFKAAEGQWIAEPGSITDPNQVKISENVEPETVEEKFGTFSGFVKDLATRFAEKYPYASDVVTSARRELDGTVTVSVSGQAGKSQWGGLTSQEAVQALQDVKQKFYDGSSSASNVMAGAKHIPDLINVGGSPVVHPLSSKQVAESIAAVTGITLEHDEE